MLDTIVKTVAGLVGGSMSQDAAEDAAAKNIQQQRQFAKHGIKWRVKDAIDAGIHPLYALGAQTASFSPVSVGGSPMGEAISQAGQDVGNALARTMTLSERQAVSAQTALQLEGMKLDNVMKATQIEKLRQINATPAFPETASTPAGSLEAIFNSPVGLQSEPARVTRTPWRYAGIDFDPSPFISDAQTAQNRHGEWVEGAWGPFGTIPHDLLYKLYQLPGIVRHYLGSVRYR